MSGIYLIIGGNMGDRENYLSICRQFIKAQIGDILQQSKIYETAAWGDYDQDGFLDLYVTNSEGPKRNFLYRNAGNGAFTKITSGTPAA